MLTVDTAKNICMMENTDAFIVRCVQPFVIKFLWQILDGNDITNNLGKVSLRSKPYCHASYA